MWRVRSRNIEGHDVTVERSAHSVEQRFLLLRRFARAAE